MERNKSAEYFSHDCNAKDDPKIMMMMAQLGLEAYGAYWIIIEFLRVQPDYSAPLMLLGPLAARYGSSKEKFEVIVTKYDLFEVNDTHFSSPSLKRRMHFLDEKREKMRSNALAKWGSDANAMQLHSKSTAIAMQVKDKDKEKDKVKDKLKKEENTLYLSFVSEPFLPVWEKWMDYKKKLGKPYKVQEGMEAKYTELYNLSKGDPELAMQIVNQSIKEQWTGFFPIKPKPQQNNSPEGLKISTKYLDSK